MASWETEVNQKEDDSGLEILYWVPQKLPQIYTVPTFVLRRLRDLQYIFAVTYETLCSFYFA